MFVRTDFAPLFDRFARTYATIKTPGTYKVTYVRVHYHNITSVRTTRTCVQNDETV